MQALYVFYDGDCGICRRCRDWLSAQPAYLPLNFIPFQSPEGPRRFPGMEAFHPEDELVVISDAGEVYLGSRAWTLCLYALKAYREWSYRLASPGWSHVAEQLVERVSSNRLTLSRWAGVKPEACSDGSCPVPRAS